MGVLGVLLHLVLLALLASPPAVIEVLESGDAMCTYTVEVVNAPTAVQVKLVGEPYLVEAYDEGGGEVPYTMSDGLLELYVFENTTVTVRCLTVLASRSGRVWVAEFTADRPVKLVLPENAVPVKLDPLPEDVELEGARVALYYPGGRIHVEYMIYVPLPPTTPAPPAGSPEPAPSRGLPRELLALLGVAVLGGAGLAVYLRRLRGGSADRALHDLDERDARILQAIRELGGSATPSEIMDRTGIPKTPLYRRLQRLAEMGLLEEVGGRHGKRYRLKQG